MLGAVGASLAAAVAGCVAGGGSEFEQGGSVDVEGNASLDDPTAAQAQQSFANQQINEQANDIEELELLDHEPVVRDDFRGLAIEGRAENTGSEVLEYVEIRIRVFDDQDRHLDTYLDTVANLGPGTVWAFDVVVLEAPEDVATYDVGTFGWPT